MLSRLFSTWVNAGFCDACVLCEARCSACPWGAELIMCGLMRRAAEVGRQRSSESEAPPAAAAAMTDVNGRARSVLLTHLGTYVW